MIQLQPPHRRLLGNDFVCGRPIIGIGVDPDLHRTAVAAVLGGLGQTTGGAYKLVDLSLAEIKQSIKGEEAVLEMTQRVQGVIQACVAAVLDPYLDAHPWVVLSVEGQEVWQGSTGRPADIIHIAQVAGACMATRLTPNSIRYRPNPPEWRGTIDKHKVQARTWAALGVPLSGMDLIAGREPYIVPVGLSGWFDPPRFNKSDWKHLGDAAGLALWGIRVCWAP